MREAIPAVTLMAVGMQIGLGSFFVLGVRALQSNLIAQFSIGLDRSGADRRRE